MKRIQYTESTVFIGHTNLKMFMDCITKQTHIDNAL